MSSSTTPANPPGEELRLSVVIPCFNEVTTLERVVSVVRAVDPPGKEIGWRDGCRALWCIIKYNLIRR